MLYTEIQPQNFLGSEEEYFKFVLPYVNMAAILFSGAEPFEQTVKTSSTEGPMGNLVKIGPAVYAMKIYNDYIILYMYVAQGQGQITPRGQKFDYN